MGWGTLRDGGVAVCDGRQGDAELGNKRLDQQGIGGDDALLGGQRCGGLDGMEALGDHGCRAPVVVTEAGLKGGASRELDRFEGRPAAQKVTEKRGIFVLQPLQPLRAIVVQRPGEAVGHPYFIPDHATPMFDKLFESAQGGAVRMERLQLVPMREQQFELECSVGGIVFGPAGRQGLTIPRQRQRMERAENEQVIRAQGEDQRTCVVRGR
jgi:hypothetical protein